MNQINFISESAANQKQNHTLLLIRRNFSSEFVVSHISLVSISLTGGRNPSDKTLSTGFNILENNPSDFGFLEEEFPLSNYILSFLFSSICRSLFTHLILILILI